MNDIDACLQGRGKEVDAQENGCEVIWPDEAGNEGEEGWAKAFAEMLQKLRVCGGRLSAKAACVEYGRIENESRNPNLEVASALRLFIGMVQYFDKFGFEMEQFQWN
ncbi:hypothetical protein VNO78_12384 [Psophocarpus tetragonolobus]|uniref:Uncharacterized protein n=1 Tax=Psophocarpus tetragonolobus TaxID=3891 RepID=A0AAN9SPT1_PSOTE